MHLIEGTPEFRLAEGPARDAETGQRAATPFAQGRLDPIHIRCVLSFWGFVVVVAHAWSFRLIS